MASWNRREVLALSIGALLGSGRSLRADEAAPEMVQYSDPRDFSIRHRMTLDLDGLPADRVELWIPVPQDDLEQTVRNVRTEPRAPLVRDTLGRTQVARLFLSG